MSAVTVSSAVPRVSVASLSRLFSRSASRAAFRLCCSARLFSFSRSFLSFSSFALALFSFSLRALVSSFCHTRSRASAVFFCADADDGARNIDASDAYGTPP